MKSKRLKRNLLSLVLLVILSIAAIGCGSKDKGAVGGADKKALSDVAGDYYIDLSDLGMKLTIYLRLTDDGKFIFSNTTDFEVNKSSGVYKTGSDDYIMIYETVNGADKSISDGLTSSFFVDSDGNLDFTHCEKIYYGSASATTTSDSSDAKLKAVRITSDYKAPDTSTAFTAGTYTASVNGVSYAATFYVDDTYLILITDSSNGSWSYYSETGTYGVNVSQLALTPAGGSRAACDVISAQELSLSVPYVSDGLASDRQSLSFKKQDVKEKISSLSGTGTVTGTGESFDVTVTIYSDGSYMSRAGSFMENGVFVPDSSTGSYKIYPDNTETKIRGLNQISTVPSGTMSTDGNKLALQGFRVRNSENLTRYKCDIKNDY